MRIDDQFLPAAPYLTGYESSELLGATVRAAGGELLTSRPVHVQYRPGSDLVVRFEASVRWGDHDPVAETLIAATTSRGPLPGTVPMEADTDGGPISVGVWRWPFDPVVTGLEAAVTPRSVADVLDVSVESLRLDVVAYRPTERAVVRATVGDVVRYLKVVAPADSGRIATRHRRLLDAGVPVPPILDHVADLGLVVMEELRGPTLRDRIKAGPGRWPDAGEFIRLVETFGAVDLVDAAPVRSRVADAIGHAAMISAVLPDQRARLDDLCGRFADAAGRVAARTGPTIHGDLYEAQVVVDGDRIVGLLDIDDAGPGDPLDDLATVVGHLRFRAENHHGREHVDRYADVLARGFAEHVAAGVDPAELDLVVAAALVGLATGPFRIQQHGWRHAVRRHLDRARRLSASATATSLDEQAG